MKTCSKCKCQKPLNEFHLKSNSNDKKQSICKKCRSFDFNNDRHQRKEYYLWKAAKTRAKKKNLDFSIIETDIIIPEKCPILGIPLFISESIWSNNSPTIDRIDNTKGYIKGNIAVISWQANNMKANLNLRDIELIEKSMDNFIKYLKKEL